MGDEHDCSTFGCPSVCECIEAKCEAADQACHQDPSCEAAEECAENCACGDTACAAACAASSNSPATQNFFGCYQANCASLDDTSAVSTLKDEHDCSTFGCPSVCECIEAKCEAADQACHQDPSCEAAEECAENCACGDTACAAACAASSNSPATQNFFGCYQANCASLDDTSTVSNLKDEHDCSTFGCPSVCE